MTVNEPEDEEGRKIAQLRSLVEGDREKIRALLRKAEAHERGSGEPEEHA